MGIIRPHWTLLSFFIFYTLHPTSAPPPLQNGQRWVPDPTCPQTRGGVYFDPDTESRCHCWGHQGYICEPPDNTVNSGGGGDRTGRGRGGNNGNWNTGNGNPGNGNGQNGCPPTARVCIINNNSNQNSNQNDNKNQNRNKNNNGNSDYPNYDQSN